MRTLTLTLTGLDPSPQHPLTSPRLGVSALKAFSLARTAWANWAVSSGPLEVGWSDTRTLEYGVWKGWSQSGG